MRNSVQIARESRREREKHLTLSGNIVEMPAKTMEQREIETNKREEEQTTTSEARVFVLFSGARL